MNRRLNLIKSASHFARGGLLALCLAACVQNAPLDGQTMATATPAPELVLPSPGPVQLSPELSATVPMNLVQVVTDTPLGFSGVPSTPQATVFDVKQTATPFGAEAQAVNAPTYSVPTYSPMAVPVGMTDEILTLSGICFESAYDAAGRVFILRNATEHSALYDGSDNSRLCAQAVTRYPFDFTGGRVLAGLWSKGVGCTARHEWLDYQRDDSAQSIVIRLRFISEGDCVYELVRPFWVGIEGAQEYDIQIVVE